MSEPSLTVVIFAFNEAENIAVVLGELVGWLEANVPDAEVVFVDDGSSDETLSAARDALRGFRHHAVRHAVNRGIGAALKTGVRHARGAWVTFLPADGQIEPDAIATLQAASTHADVVFSIYADRDDGLDRTLLSAGVRGLIFAVHGVHLASDGPYLFRRAIFVPDELPPDSFFLNFELPIRALAAGLRTQVVTIRCRPRRAGHSKSTGLRRIWSVARDLADLRRRRIARALTLLRGR